MSVLDEELPDELLKEPELNPLLDFELLELDLLLLLELDLPPLDLANTVVLSDGFILVICSV
ncbi:hypothetical protein [Clostridium saccharoperbutylacetonicum]|uniref:hypothetical protein n=1 Tax=Clostridium saccharoperbutylacetonicum TaxID=36745 RepID=UPI00034A04FE|nr:hypothetical protein [Clostridium saccharoperbutylacetonicum]NRT60223.1 hypothetical protein [Clostridium saccharoperbutylacetonicum]NSB23535.1 hypothetical protein [Clostridium saccharoperbutylacetonicum]NSB33549.1 hypothetical protein [Clostridium saccharoperbutylacetonicum]